MRIPLFRFPRLALLAAACLLTLPATSQAENAFSKIGGKIKQGVNKVATAVSPKNVGSAVKRTAQAAKDMVTPGPSKPAKTTPAPRATIVHETRSAPKTVPAKPARATAAVTKPKRPAAKPEKEKTEVAQSKPKKTERKSSEESVPKQLAKQDEETPSTPPETSVNTIPADARPATGSTGEAAPPPEAAPAARRDLPFGTPAFGRKGFVYSPYAPDQGMIDVNDIPAGTKVRCPYTSKIFRIP